MIKSNYFSLTVYSHSIWNMFAKQPATNKQQSKSRKKRKKKSQRNAPRISMFYLYNSGSPHIFWCLWIYVHSTELSIFCSRFFSSFQTVGYMNIVLDLLIRENNLSFTAVFTVVYGRTESLFTVQLPLQFYFHISAWSRLTQNRRTLIWIRLFTNFKLKLATKSDT